MDRFWNKVKVAGPAECWEWRASTEKKNGYGKFGVGNRRWDRAHRVSWRIHHGDIPRGLFVLHSCDNPLCVNPEHLYLGTKRDNAQDRELRGRGNHATGDRHGRRTHPGQLVGSKNGRARLNEEAVADLLTEYFKQGRDALELSRQYGVSTTTVRDIVSGKLWPHVEGRV